MGLQQSNPRRNSQEMNKKGNYSHWGCTSGLRLLDTCPRLTAASLDIRIAAIFQDTPAAGVEREEK